MQVLQQSRNEVCDGIDIPLSPLSKGDLLEPSHSSCISCSSWCFKDVDKDTFVKSNLVAATPHQEYPENKKSLTAKIFKKDIFGSKAIFL